MNANTVKVLWGKRPGDEFESLITEHADRIEAAKRWALANGFTDLRVAEIDLSTPPDFAATVNRIR